MARLLIFFFLITLTSPARGDWHFTDVTHEVVDKNPPRSGPVFDYAFVDINDDHLLDIVVNNHHQTKGSPAWLGTADHRFVYWQELPEALIPIAGFHLGEVDLNGDGRTDLVCTGNEGGVRININTTPTGQRKPTFTPVALKHSSHLVSFVDLNADGTLETLIRPGLIYGDLKKPPIHRDMQYGNWVVSDFDNDGWPDLFCAGESRSRHGRNGPRKLFRNQQGTLTEVTDAPDFVNTQIGGIAKAADFNHDGQMDLYIFGGLNTSDEQLASMRLYVGDGKFGFTDVSESAGFLASTQKPGYSMVYIADIDNDSYPDIVNQGNYGSRAWRNLGDGRFAPLPKEQTKPWLIGAHGRFDDFNMDGQLDFVTGPDEPGWKDRSKTIRVFRNDTHTTNHWLKIQLRQSGGNTQCLGAMVRLLIPGSPEVIGTQMLYADTEGYHPRLHFGLGAHEQVDIHIHFPGKENPQHFPSVPADQYLVLHPDGSSKPVAFKESAKRTILAFGDSITAGGRSFVSYRSALLPKLQAAGAACEFIGPGKDASSAHAGYGGRNTRALRGMIENIYRKYPADIVLLHSGHNSFSEHKPVAGIVADTEAIIAAIHQVNPKVQVLLAQVIPAGKLPKYDYIPALNRALAESHQGLIDKGYQVTLVDQASGFDWKTDTVKDKVHPNEAGAEKMAEQWFKALVHRLTNN